MEWDRLLSTATQTEREKEPVKWAEYPISDFEKDYKSIISSAAFRRLQDKTQVFPLDKSDFVRTRLTHSIEVSSIGRQLGIMITQNKKGYLPPDFDVHQEEISQKEREWRLKVVAGIPEVLSCAGLLHDLGNPPFGHFGEVVIRDWFKRELADDRFSFRGCPVRAVLGKQNRIEDLCHFEGNAQAFRILCKARHNPGGYDANLSYAIIHTLIKYPTDSVHIDPDSTDVRRHKLGYFDSERGLFEEVCRSAGTRLSDGGFARHPLTFLMEAADDIAYATSDLEDALKKGLFTADQFIAFFEDAVAQIPEEEEAEAKKKAKSIELIEDLKQRLNSGKRSRESDWSHFQKWMVYVRGWLMYVVAFSFSKNYRAIMEGTYFRDLFEDGFHRYSIQIMKRAMSEFVFDSAGILKLELSAQKIITSLLHDFIYAVLYWETEESRRMTKADKKYIHLISENYRQDYRCLRGQDEAENLYLRFLMVTDFISGMTDSYAKNLYRELNGID